MMYKRRRLDTEKKQRYENFGGEIEENKKYPKGVFLAKAL